MHLERYVAAILLASALASCTGVEVPAASATVSSASEANTRAMSGVELIRAASKLATVAGNEVAIAQGDEHVVAVVSFRKGDGEEEPSSCLLTVVEASSGILRVVGSNNAIISCPLDSSAEEVRSAIALTVSPTAVTAVRNSVRGGEEFLLERGENGTWYVTRASYAGVVEDPGTGEMMASVEEVAYPANGKGGVPLDKYSYDAIEKDLVSRIVE